MRAPLCLLLVATACAAPPTLAPAPDPAPAPLDSEPLPVACVVTDAQGRSQQCAPLDVWLRRVTASMRPVCQPRCGDVGLQRDDSLDRGAALQSAVPGLASFIKVRPDPALTRHGLWFWALAHEYGHHLDSTLGAEPEDPWIRELRADAFAGCAHALAHVPLDPVTQLLRQSEETPGSAADFWADVHGSDGDHPRMRHHVAALEAGYRACQAGSIPASAVADSSAAAVEDALGGRRRALDSMGRTRPWL